MSDPRVSIILPVYNQAAHIGAVVEDYVAALQRVPITYEILLVVNGPCRDDSLGTCQKLAEKHGVVKVVHSVAGGWGLAVKRGIENSRGELICYTNSARTHAEDLMLCLLYAVAHPDVVIKANRKIRDNVFRRMGSLVYNLECRSLFDLPFWDINGTPKVFPRSLDKLRGLTQDDDLIDLEFNVICREENYRVLEIPILSTRRHGGKSTTGMSSAFKMYKGAYRLKRQRKRGSQDAHKKIP